MRRLLAIAIFLAGASLSNSVALTSATAEEYRAPIARFYLPNFRYVPRYYQEHVRPYTNPGAPLLPRPLLRPQYIPQQPYWYIPGPAPIWTMRPRPYG